MALRNRLDPHRTAAALARWWCSRYPDAEDLTVTGLHTPQSSGMSSETVLFTIHYRRGGAELARELVARVIPPDNQVFPAHDFEVERLAMHAARAGGLPAPHVLAIEHDTGVLGAPFLGHPGNDVRPLVQHIEHCQGLYRWVARACSHPTIETGLDWVKAHLPTADAPSALCWGDARLGNPAATPSPTCSTCPHPTRPAPPGSPATARQGNPTRAQTGRNPDDRNDRPCRA